eukprot:TRINITY_DN226_c0_g6_i4.p1 TRINITY_DN226_c0_g6~~TRINITY_DN226_c0_g6_i4.p1  ORF type:complete len:248 (+),score=138.47 TRINITY_DN226_c0_g6_i4:49-792(+)
MRVAILLLGAVLAASLLPGGAAMEIKPRKKKSKKKQKAPNEDFDPVRHREALKCTSCLAVAWELGALLSSEKPQDVQTGYGNKGKKADYMSSEIRSVEIMERLCPLMRGYGLFTPDPDAEGGEVSLYHRMADHPYLPKEEQYGNAKALESFCFSMQDEYEEDFERLIALGTGIGAGDMEALATNLCVDTTKSCKDEAEAVEKIPTSKVYEKILKDQYDQNQAAKKAEEEKKAEKEKKAEEEKEPAEL